MMNLQKISITLIIGLMLGSCGSSGGGNSGSSGDSNDYAPKTATAFETKFVNQTITLPSGNKMIIRNGKKSDHVISTKILAGASGSFYTYEYTSKNNSKSTHIITESDSKKITCNYVWSFSSDLSGSVVENCSGQAYIIDSVTINANGSFAISGKN